MGTKSSSPRRAKEEEYIEAVDKEAETNGQSVDPAGATSDGYFLIKQCENETATQPVIQEEEEEGMLGDRKM